MERITVLVTMIALMAATIAGTAGRLQLILLLGGPRLITRAMFMRT